MQCLYCETELKALRGFFDEDFCCREHREKYFSSFRKSWDQMPAHQYVAPEIASANGEDAPIAPQFAVSTLETEATPPRVESDDPAVFVRTFQLVSDAAGEPELTAIRFAELMPLHLTASDNIPGSARCAEPIEPSALIRLPQAAALPAVAMTAESELIFQFELPDMPAAPRWTGLPLVSFEPAAQTERVETGWSTPGASADPQPQSESLRAETGTLVPAAAVNRAFEPGLQIGLPVLAERSPGASLPLSSDYCDLFPDCLSLESHPAALFEFAPVLPIELPGFAAAPEALEIEAQDQRDTSEQISAEATEDAPPLAADLSPQTASVHHQAIPEIAPPMTFHSPAVAATSLRASGDSDETTAALVASPSPLTMPGFASILEPVAPAAAVQMATGAPLEPAPPEAAVPGAEQDAGKPLRLTFGSLVRIKNWKLRITFARSA